MKNNVFRIYFFLNFALVNPSGFSGQKVDRDSPIIPCLSNKDFVVFTHFINADTNLDNVRKQGLLSSNHYTVWFRECFVLEHRCPFVCKIFPIDAYSFENELDRRSIIEKINKVAGDFIGSSQPEAKKLKGVFAAKVSPEELIFPNYNRDPVTKETWYSIPKELVLQKLHNLSYMLWCTEVD